MRHHDATDIGDYRAANAAYRVLVAAYRSLRDRGPDSRARLLLLLDDERPAIRLWAAAHALEFAPHPAEAALERLSAERCIIGVNARMTLAEWRKGSLGHP